MKCSIEGCNKKAKFKFYPDRDGEVFCGKRHACLWFKGQLFEIKEVI